MSEKEVQTYKPSVNIHGFFIDRNPFLKEKKESMISIICPCGSRKKKAFDNMSQFKRHLQSQSHQNWIETMNLERKIQQLETELYEVGGRVNEKEELWYGQIFPDHKDIIPNEDLWSESIDDDSKSVHPETFDYTETFPDIVEKIPTLS
jgi:hypothetical protein